MRTLLIGKDLQDIVDSDHDEPRYWNTICQNDKQAKETKERNSLASYHIQSALGKSLFSRIANVKSIRNSQKAIKEVYQGSDQVKFVNF